MSSLQQQRAEFHSDNWFTWTFPGAPISVRIELGVVARLEREIDQQPDAEICGVLFGHPRPEQATVEIHDYSRIPREINTNDGQLIDIQWLNVLRQARPVVGYFATHLDCSLTPRQAELDLVDAEFRGASNVVLLIQASGMQKMAGIFFWKHNTFFDLSMMDFPFDAAFLRKWETRHESQPIHEIPVLETQRLDSSLIPTESRLMSANDQHGARRSLGDIVEPIAALISFLAVRCVRIRHSLASVIRTTVAMILRGSLSLAFSRIRVLAAVPTRISLLLNKLLRLIDRTRTSSRRALIANGLAILASIALSSVITWNLRSSSPKPGVEDQAPSLFSPKLEAERERNGVAIRWNAQSTQVTHADKGRLVIKAGNQQPKTETLTREQLASGQIHHRAGLGRLAVSLELEDASGRTTTESIVVTPASSVLGPARARQSSENSGNIPKTIGALSTGHESQRADLPSQRSTSELAAPKPSPIPPANQITAGMDKHNVIELLGRPSLQLVTTDRGNAIETLVYGADPHSLTIRFKDGKVVSAQSW
jgi:hypothetical protein